MTHITTATQTHNGGIPSGIMQGELLVAHVASTNAAVYSSTSGYTFWDWAVDVDNFAVSGIWLKTAGASETGCNFTSDVVGRETITVVRVSGHHATLFQGDKEKNATTGGAGTITVPSLDIVQADELVLVAYSSNFTDGFQTITGFTEVSDASSSGPNRSAGISRKAYAAPGSTGPIVVNQETGGNRVAAIAIAIRPTDVVQPDAPSGLTAVAYEE